ncbi:hypothetical protein [Ornithinibacillus sp. FSL M8-0202]|uniref:hypothetical protein n=1 Tax=Ornithinibacillus sp. FSL M8-0202 TaxID=2921616 RepID=UPI0030D1F4E7
MGLALVKVTEVSGACRKDFETALLQLGDITRKVEQRLTISVNNSIEQHYEEQLYEYEQVKITIHSLLKQ